MLGFRSMFLWEELFQGVKLVGEASDKKMSLEECILVFNSAGTSGDLRASKDGMLRGDVKSAMLAGTFQVVTMETFVFEKLVLFGGY